MSALPPGDSARAPLRRCRGPRQRARARARGLHWLAARGRRQHVAPCGPLQQRLGQEAVHADSLRQAGSGSMLGARGRWRLRPWVVAAPRARRGSAAYPTVTLRGPSGGARARAAGGAGGGGRGAAHAAARGRRRQPAVPGGRAARVARARRAGAPPSYPPPQKAPAGQPRPPGAPLASVTPPARRRRAAGAPPGLDGRVGLRNALCSIPVQAPPCSSPALEHPSAPRR